MNVIRCPLPATEIDRELTRELREAAGDDLAPRECFANSLRAMCLFPTDKCLYYVEGWLITIEGEYAIEHGWLELGDCVIDLTVDDQEPEDYYAVFRYTVDEAIKRVGRRSKLPFLLNRKADRQIMRESFLELPINHAVATYWAILGELNTGIKSIILEKEAS